MKTFFKLLILSTFFLPVNAKIMDNFPYVCVCDKSFNTFVYLDCKNKMGSTLLELDKENNLIKSSFDEKKYKIFDNSLEQLTAIFEATNYSSIISIDKIFNLEFKIIYPEYKKKWSYQLRCISAKK